jgi:hypothetical protein
MKTFVLLVTWLVYNRPPSSYQTTFNSVEACEAARDAVLTDGRRLKAEFEQKALTVFGGTQNMYSAALSMQAPAVTAVCAAQ